MFTKKHYEFLAKWLRESQTKGQWHDDAVSVLMDRLMEDNPKFDEDKFLRAASRF